MRAPRKHGVLSVQRPITFAIMITMQIDNIDWAILDSLSDDLEPMEIIIEWVQKMNSNFEIALIQDRIEALLKTGLLFAKGEADLCYGLTKTGCEIWEDHATEFSQSPIDWSNSWKIELDHKTSIGHVLATSRQRCESALSDQADLLGISIDSASLSHSIVPAFDAKYYKQLKGAYRIDFHFVAKKH